MLHAFLQVAMVLANAYWTVSFARRPRWRPWVIGWWAINTVLAIALFAWGDYSWKAVIPAVNLTLAHFAPLIDLALAGWADRMWEDLHRR